MILLLGTLVSGLRSFCARPMGIGDMGNFIYFLAIVCTALGGISLIWSCIAEESDGARLIARVIRAVGYLLLAGLLKGFIH
jgi:hypothetical protein